MILEATILFLTLLYVGQLLVFLYSFTRPRGQKGYSEQPFVSVIVAARNEEKSIARCIQSLIDQDYPEDKYEIIIVNDHSDDRTVEISSQFCDRYGRVHLHHAPEPSRLRGKTNALAHGIDCSRGEIIFITDADCVATPAWISSTIQYYHPDVGLIGGMTLQRGTGYFTGMQSLDWAFLLGIASATVNMGVPLSSIGNNLSFRRKAYDEVGGYRKLPFSITEDFMLFQAIAGTKAWDFLYPVQAESLVMSEPCSTLGELVRQKRRWARGGLRMKLYGFLVMIIGFGLHAAIVAGLALGSIAVAGTALMAKIVVDYMFLRGVLFVSGKTDHLKYFYGFEVYFISYTLLLPLLVLLGGKIEWKGRLY